MSSKKVLGWSPMFSSAYDVGILELTQLTNTTNSLT